MSSLPLRPIFLVAAFVLFVLAALNTPSPKVNLVAAGLACLTLALWFAH
jgi:hypothetical protein